jgi:alanine racemase
MAEASGVFHYELLTGLGRRVERRFVRSGHKTQYEHL